MKSLFIISILALGSLSAAAETANVCYSQCLGVSTANQELRFLGNLNSVGPSRVEAWRELNQKCYMKAKRVGVDPVLVQGTLVYSADHTWSSYSWQSASVQASGSFYYVSASAQAESESSYYENDQMKIKLQWANPHSNCSLESVDPADEGDYYDGDLPVQG